MTKTRFLLATAASAGIAASVAATGQPGPGGGTASYWMSAVAIVSLIALGALARSAPGPAASASGERAMRVLFWRALAMAVRAGMGRLAGAVG